MELKKCTKCGTTLPKTEEYFKKSKNTHMKTGYRLSSACIECDRKRWRERYQKNQKKMDKERADRRIIEGFKLPCMEDNPHVKKHCIKIECAHHMAQLHPTVFNNYTPVNQMVDFLVSMPYTCIHDVFQAYPDEMTFADLGHVLNCSPQAAQMRFAKAMDNLSKNVSHEEIKDALDE